MLKEAGFVQSGTLPINFARGTEENTEINIGIAGTVAEIRNVGHPNICHSLLGVSAHRLTLQ
jgi:hypothetical protein